MQTTDSPVKTAKPVIVYDRKTGNTFEEKIYGEFFLRWLYETRFGRLLSPLLTIPMFSKIYGSLQDTSWSRNKIPSFVKRYDIDLHDFLPQEHHTPEDPYESFNTFFIRKFKEGKRLFVSETHKLPAFAEGRYLAYERVSRDELFPVKGQYLSSSALLEHPQWNQSFEGGPLVIARLCPVDYHRFHFPDEGTVLDYFQRGKKLHSVSPLALQARDSIFCENERHITILQTKQFGLLAYIEVGAICVGKIVQSHSCDISSSYKRGEEKGYFLFGGSTVIVLGQAKAWVPSQDLILNTKKCMETRIELGDVVAYTQTK
jgi:phosphatidylserine decarboxylase